MKIVISGYYGFDNLGDEAILKAIITSLKKVDSTIDITVLSNNPAKTQKLFIYLQELGLRGKVIL